MHQRLRTGGQPVHHRAIAVTRQRQQRLAHRVSARPGPQTRHLRGPVQPILGARLCEVRDETVRQHVEERMQRAGPTPDRRVDDLGVATRQHTRRTDQPHDSGHNLGRPAGTAAADRQHVGRWLGQAGHGAEAHDGRRVGIMGGEQQQPHHRIEAEPARLPGQPIECGPGRWLTGLPRHSRGFTAACGPRRGPASARSSPVVPAAPRWCGRRR